MKSRRGVVRISTRLNREADINMKVKIVTKDVLGEKIKIPILTNSKNIKKAQELFVMTAVQTKDAVATSVALAAKRMRTG